MMWDKYLAIGLIIFILTGITNGLSHSKEKKDVLIIYEAKTRLGESFSILEPLEIYLHHFDVSIKSIYVEDLNFPVSNYDYVIYIGLQERKLTKDILENLSKAKNLIWIEANVGQYAEYIGWSNFEDYGYKTGYVSIIYKKESVSINLDIPIYVAYPKDRKDLSLLYDYTQKVPWVWTKGNLWYFGRLDFEDNSFLVFFDILHDIFKENHTEDRRILLLLDEINPLTSAEKLRELIQSQCCEEVPISLVIYPEITHSRDTYYIEDDRKLIDVIKLADENDGAIILGIPPNKEDINEKINRDLIALARVGIFPIAFSLPYPNMEGYDKASRYFKIILYRGLIGTKISNTIGYPINMYNYNPNNPTDYSLLVRRAEEFRILRDAILGITFPSYAPTENLRRLINDIRALGYDFLNLRGEDFYVETSHIKVMKVDGKKVVISNVPPLGKTFLQRIFEVFVNYLRLILIIIVSLFTIIIFYLIKDKRKLYEIGEKE